MTNTKHIAALAAQPAASAEADRQQRGGDVLIPVEPTHAILAALSGEWHSSKHGKTRERYAAMIAVVSSTKGESNG